MLARRIRRDAGRRTNKLTIDDASDRKEASEEPVHQERPQSDEIPRQGRAEQARLAGGRERFPQTAEARSGPDTMVPM